MSDVVSVKRWENKDLGIKVWMIRIEKKYWFFGKEVAETLGYTDPKKTIQNRITDPEEKKTMEEILGPNFRRILERNLIKSDGDKLSLSDFFKRVHKNQKLLTEFALYEFCGSSKKEKARPFHKWVFNTIVKIRETGSYTLPGGAVDNPLDLVTKIEILERRIESIQRKTKKVYRKPNS